MKPLSPTMREKKRYLFLKGTNLRENVEKSILEFIGILGMAKTCLGWIKSDRESAIISVNRQMLEQVKASFALWPEPIEVKRVSGTLKGLKKDR
jgi:RNase P/RNase MRP subunit POP5